MINGESKGVFGTGLHNVCMLVLGMLLLSNSLACSGCGGTTETGDTLGKQYLDALKIPDPAKRVEALILVARQQNNAKDIPGTKQSLQSAQLACTEIEESLTRAEAYANLALAQAELGSKDDAKNSVKEVRSLLGEITDLEPIVRIRAKLALVQGKFLESAASAEYEIGEAKTAIESITATVGRVRAYRVLATTCRDLELTDDATSLMDLAQQAANEAEEPKSKSEALAGIALTYSRWGDSTQADTNFSEATETANGIEDAWARSYAQISVGTALRGAGRADAAATMLTAADASAQLVKDTQLRDQLYRLIEGQKR